MQIIETAIALNQMSLLIRSTLLIPFSPLGPQGHAESALHGAAELDEDAFCLPGRLLRAGSSQRPRPQLRVPRQGQRVRQVSFLVSNLLIL